MEPDKSHAARARRTEAGALLETACIGLTRKVQSTIDALAALKPDDPASDALVDRLDRLTVILARLRDQVLAREWSTRLAAAILRSPALLGSTPGSPLVRKVGAWAARTAKEGSIDARTVAARNAREAARALAARQRLGDQGTGESAEA